VNRRQEVLYGIAQRSAAGRTVTPAEVEMPLDKLQELSVAFGFPSPGADDPTFTPAEAAALGELWRQTDTWPFELTVQLGRVYGRLLARMAHATVQEWLTVVEPQLTDIEQARHFDHILPVSDAVLAGVHRRWVEREAEQLALRDATAVPAGTGMRSVEVSFLFVDVKDFTAFAYREGDDAAVRIVDTFATVVTREHGPDARLTKLLGDGYMCAYHEPRLAVEAGARMIDAMDAPGLPGLHASVHHGLAIPREGDYFGAVVNLTARLLGVAGYNELVATRAAVERCPEFSWEPIGTTEVRGVAEEIEVFRLNRGS
jgi:class 3 adenylate cyclase